MKTDDPFSSALDPASHTHISMGRKEEFNAQTQPGMTDPKVPDKSALDNTSGSRFEEPGGEESKATRGSVVKTFSRAGTMPLESSGSIDKQLASYRENRLQKYGSDLVETDRAYSPSIDEDSPPGKKGAQTKPSDKQLTVKTDPKDQMVPVSPDWSMFVKQQILGQGAYGTVYKVKSLKTSMVLGGSEGVRVVLNSPTSRMKRKLNKNMLGTNMQSTIEKQNKVRSLVMDQLYVVKEIDTALLPKEAAMEALQEIEILGELDSHYVVGYYDSFIDGTTINII